MNYKADEIHAEHLLELRTEYHNRILFCKSLFGTLISGSRQYTIEEIDDELFKFFIKSRNPKFNPLNFDT